MRLYLKLFAMLLIAAAAQFTFQCADGDGCTLWFELRCQLAVVSGDRVMLGRLVDEQYQRRLASRGAEYRSQLHRAQLAAEAYMRAAGDDSVDRAAAGRGEDHRDVAQIERDRDIELELEPEALCSAAR